MLRAARPAGVILFGRNVTDRTQLRRLIDALRGVLAPEAVLLVDQEGGRVARLRPPHWPSHPAAGLIGALYAKNPEAGLRAAWLTGALIGLDCAEMGLDVVCAPVLDRVLPSRSDVVGDRGYAENPETVAVLGRAVAQGLLAAGVQPVIKHLPGHGRARVDSHLHLPIVSDNTDDDLLPFQRNADLPWAMTAHIVFPDWDPTHPATLSPKVIERIIRGAIGFKGVLVSDDLAMHALIGTPGARAAQALAAGCDLAMYCTGDAIGNADIFANCSALSDATVSRLGLACTQVCHSRLTLDANALSAERNLLLP
jgi:beta-N-acetylhexosaminidase